MIESLQDWALQHGPEHLRYAAARGSVTTAAMDAIAESLALAIEGRVCRPSSELIKWTPRSNPHPAMLDRLNGLQPKISAWLGRFDPPILLDDTKPVLRVEEQLDATDPSSVVKYSGALFVIEHQLSQPRFVLVNLEALK